MYKTKHFDMGLAKLSLRSRFSAFELDSAEAELWVKGVLKPCSHYGKDDHEGCVDIRETGS